MKKNKVEELKKMLEGKKQDRRPEEEGSTEPDSLQKKIGAAETGAKKYEEEAKQNHEKLLRVLADFDNYKKRIAREHEDRAKYSHELLLKELLPVLDDFDRVLEHLPAEVEPEIQGMIEGVQLTHRHFTTALKKLGLKEVETKNRAFDPHYHEALNQVETDEQPEGEIVTCHRKGYLLHERLLRPALVTVAKAKAY